MRTYRPWDEQPWYIERSKLNNPLRFLGRGSIEDVVTSTPVADSGQNNVSFMGAVRYALPVLASIVAANIFLSSCTYKPPAPKTSNPPQVTITTTAPPTATITTPTTPVPLPGLENIISEQQIFSYVSDFNRVQPITDDLISKIAAVNSSLYYKFTGNTFENGITGNVFGDNGKFIATLLNTEDYKALEGKPGGTMPNSVGCVNFDRDKGWLIYVDIGLKAATSGNPLRILNILTRETANAELSRVVPPFYKLLDTARYPTYDDFLKEVAQKYGLESISDTKTLLGPLKDESMMSLYQAATFHYLTEAGAINYSALSTLPDNEKAIDLAVADMIKSSSENIVAGFIDWYAALNHPDTLVTLQQTGQITSQQALGLFKKYMQKNQTSDGLGEIYADVVHALRSKAELAPQIKAFCKQSQRPAMFVYFP